MSIHWKNWSPSGVPLAAYRLKRSKHHEEIIPFTDAERVAGADAGTVPDLPAERDMSILSPPGRFWRRLSVWLPVVSACMPLSMCWNATGGSCRRNRLLVKIVASLFLQPVPWRRRAAALVVMVATFISLVAAGWIFTALIYLVALVFFRLIRTACRQRFEGREPCQS
ncbi:DNZ54_00345 family protein [Escherichia coli]|nr:DNZ54_00345 family protein [Escherichia coli]